jgi:multidrug efflux pump subunit AcrB
MKKVHEKQSYLDRIKFDSKLMVGWIASYVTNIRIVILLTIGVAIIGLVSYFNLPQRLNPEIKIPIVTVVTILPGAGPEDVEKLVTIPLENELRGLTGLDTISSNSQENVSVITMQFVNSVVGEKAKDDAQNSVDAVTDLPEDALTPNVELLDFENEPVWQFAVTTKNDPVSLFAFSRRLRDTIEEVSEVKEVTVAGLEEQIIAIDVTPEKLSQYGLNPLSLSGAIKSEVGAYPSGNVQTDKNTFALTIDPTIDSVESIRNLLISVDGNSVRLGDVAEVRERSNTNQPASYIATQKEQAKTSVTFLVYKRSNADIIKTAEKVHTVVDEQVKMAKGNFEVTSIINNGELIKNQFTDLLGEFRSTIILIFISLFVFLGLRQAIVSAFTVPLTFLSAFIFMRATGMTINFLSLFAFLLALGLLVDDTIVVVSAMTTYFKTRKFTPTQTGLLVWRDTIVPIWSTTVTTIWSFVPLLLSAGIIGEFIKPIPVVVTVTMISSTGIAVLITLPIMIILLKPEIPYRVVILGRIILSAALLGIFIGIFKDNPLFLFIFVAYVLFLLVAWHLRKPLITSARNGLKKYPMIGNIQRTLTRYSSHGMVDIGRFAAAYERFITRVLNSPRARKIVVVSIVSYAVFSFLLVPFGLVKNEFFPKSDGDTVYINMELPSGTNLEVNKRETQDLVNRFRKTEGIEFVVADVGAALNTDFGGRSNKSNASLFTFHLPEEKERKIGSIEIADALRQDIKSYTKGKLSVIEESGGPPAGADLQLKLSGSDLSVLDTYADKIANYLSKQSGIVNVEKSIKPGTSALVFVPDMDALNSYGLNAQTVGFWTRTAVSGFTLDEVNFETGIKEKKDIIFSFGNVNQSPDSIGRLTIPTQKNGSIPLSALGRFEVKANPTQITREEGKRTISVSSGVSRGYSVSEKNQELLKFADSLNLPDGYEYTTGGVNEENEKSVQSILQAMILAFLLILVTMVIQFKSYRQAVIVLLVIPLAVSSVFFAFALTGTPLSFPALIGVLSLFGIVVTNSMFIVDKINLNINEGMPYVKAIADAGASRMEPIILTKLCTVLGLLPITLADPLWRGLGGAIISGILLASSIMLLFIPVVYYDWMKPNKK